MTKTTTAAFIPFLPERIEGLGRIATNLWWSWQPEARTLFRLIDANLWLRTRHNPLELLQRVSPDRLEAVARQDEFLERYEKVLRDFEGLSDREHTWFHRTVGAWDKGPIAYFCAEFALHNSIPVYSGGLGVLAGDHCKEASDLAVPFVAVGLFYTKGYFDQRLRTDGWQQDSDELINTAATPLHQITGPEGEPSLVTLPMDGRDVQVGAWCLKVGRIAVYLLDTDLERNDPVDRELSAKLYGGNPELRLKQEWVLGVGGVRVLRALGIHPSAWHANEGHATFMFVERLRELTAGGVPRDEALKQVRATSIFTTHTPVPAGHDTFGDDDVLRVAGSFLPDAGPERDWFLELGHHPVHQDHSFHMTVAALRLAGRVNGVAARHEKESRRIWRDAWPERDPAKVPIGHVTNGVHLGTWMAMAMRELLRQHLGPDWEFRLDEPGLWDRILEIDDSHLWHTHERLKYMLLNFIREEARQRWRDYWKDPHKLAVAGTLLNPMALTIGFARRFATYKRADLLLSNPDRLRRLLVNPRRPVQLLFAGKAHPADDPGKQILQRVYTAAQDPHFEGRIAFLEDYEMHLAHRLVQGVDLWLNMPRVPMEACGTSGMKAALNAVPQLSTLDGWWAEGYNGLNGWAVPVAGPEENPDETDAERVFTLLEEQIVPRFYDRPAGGVPLAWVQTMKQALKVGGERFTSRRMLKQYVTEYYIPAAQGSLEGDDPPGD